MVAAFRLDVSASKCIQLFLNCPPVFVTGEPLEDLSAALLTHGSTPFLFVFSLKTFKTNSVDWLKHSPLSRRVSFC